MTAYEAYLADWEAKHPNIVKPERLLDCPCIQDAKPIYGYRVWDNRSKCFELVDGRVVEIGVTSIWTECYAVFQSRDAWNAYKKPMSSNEFWNQ